MIHIFAWYDSDQLVFMDFQIVWVTKLASFDGSLILTGKKIQK